MLLSAKPRTDDVVERVRSSAGVPAGANILRGDCVERGFDRRVREQNLNRRVGDHRSRMGLELSPLPDPGADMAGRLRPDGAPPAGQLLGRPTPSSIRSCSRRIRVPATVTDELGVEGGLGAGEAGEQLHDVGRSS